MSRIVWKAPEHRAYEAGIDRGVLAVDGEATVAWNGLVSVSEAPTGGEIKPLYQDGFRIHNHTGVKEFEATLDALSYPDEFGLCEGFANDSAAIGLVVDQQPPRTFNLSYRTGMGSSESTSVTDHMLHLVYNCTVVPSSRAYSTLADSPSITTYSWTIATVPRREVPGILPAAHFSVDSTKADPVAYKAIEDILYGTDTSEPRFLEPLELRTILSGV